MVTVVVLTVILNNPPEPNPSSGSGKTVAQHWCVTTVCRSIRSPQDGGWRLCAAPPTATMKPQTNRRKMVSLLNADEIKGKWKQQIGAAKVAWGKLTEDELLKLEGHQQKLAGLIQVRYAITRDEAEKQVRRFFDKQ
ncbi:MAG: CsbD family protein [Porticoccaceae bacterium]